MPKIQPKGNESSVAIVDANNTPLGSARLPRIRTVADAKRFLSTVISAYTRGIATDQAVRTLCYACQVYVSICEVADFEERIAKVEKARSKPDSTEEPDYLQPKGENDEQSNRQGVLRSSQDDSRWQS